MTTFKTCTGCGREFSMEDILNSSQIEPAGMQFLGDDFDWNMYYFSHVCAECGSTFVIPVKDFLPVIDEPIPETVLSGGDRCEGHCTSMTDLQQCNQDCFYAPFRRFLLGLMARRGAPSASTSPGAMDGFQA